MFLTPTDIAELTGRKRPSAQQKQLNAMGVQFKVRADGSLVVLRSHVDKLLGGQAERKQRSREPNWEALAHA